MTERVLAGAALCLVGSVLFAAPGSLAAQDTTRGRAVYDKWCADCHGDGGAGDGPAAASMLPRPRDFTLALYQVRSTASGQLPTDADLRRAIDEGLPGTAMPGWRDRLSQAERRDVMAYLKTFSAFFTNPALAPVALEFGRPPGGGSSAAALRVGRQIYDSIECFKCHGPEGRGDGPSAPTLEDDAGMPIYAADLAQNWLFNGGGSVEDVYRRLRTGLDGTPMPSFSDLLDQNFITDEDLWRVAQYVRSLAPEAPPAVRDVIHAPQRAALPRAPDDSAWATVPRYWFPLVGQIIRQPRWFAPAVQGVWVQAVHSGDALALRLTWQDRSQSPDTAWLEFAGRVLAAVAGDDSVAPAAELWPDQIAVQFPRAVPAGAERPYFLMGTAREPVYQWRWSSAPPGVTAGLARGLERFDSLSGAGTPGAEALYDGGEWRVVLTRALATPDTANELQMSVGQPIPIAFFAWDGSSGEHGSRMAISSWYFLALDQPTPPRVFVLPVVAAVLTLGMGLVVVRRAQRTS
jgi:DMSO reductase family type II enzyme heme b subunit